jgi:hypothetical protein
MPSRNVGELTQDRLWWLFQDNPQVAVEVLVNDTLVSLNDDGKWLDTTLETRVAYQRLRSANADLLGTAMYSRLRKPGERRRVIVLALKLGRSRRWCIIRHEKLT